MARIPGNILECKADKEKGMYGKHQNNITELCNEELKSEYTNMKNGVKQWKERGETLSG